MSSVIFDFFRWLVEIPETLLFESITGRADKSLLVLAPDSLMTMGTGWVRSSHLFTVPQMGLIVNAVVVCYLQ